MPGERRILLANGLWRDGAHHDRAVVRPMTGADEILWAEAEPWPAMQATALLAATVEAIGAIAPVPRAHVLSLSIGDRERLLLALYALSFGSRPDAVVDCGACGQTIELPLDLDAMLEAPVATARAPEHSIRAGSLLLRYRAPDGADHERAARLAATGPDRAAAALRNACVIAIDGGAAGVEKLDAVLEDALRRLDPAAETIVAANCPSCGAGVRGALDALALIAGRLGQPGGVLVDVDRLARAYHWSEAAILALPTARRQRYLALLDRAEAA